MGSDQFKLFKLVVKSIVSLSVASTASEIIRNNVAKDTIPVRITQLVVGGIAFMGVWENTDYPLDQINAWVIRKKQELEEEEETITPRDGLTFHDEMN